MHNNEKVWRKENVTVKIVGKKRERERDVQKQKTSRQRERRNSWHGFISLVNQRAQQFSVCGHILRGEGTNNVAQELCNIGLGAVRVDHFEKRALMNGRDVRGRYDEHEK